MMDEFKGEYDGDMDFLLSHKDKKRVYELLLKRLKKVVLPKRFIITTPHAPDSWFDRMWKKYHGSTSTTIKENEK